MQVVPAEAVETTAEAVETTDGNPVPSTSDSKVYIFFYICTGLPNTDITSMQKKIHLPFTPPPHFSNVVSWLITNYSLILINLATFCTFILFFIVWTSILYSRLQRFWLLLKKENVHNHW